MASQNASRLPAARRATIVARVAAAGELSVTRLAKELRVSSDTIRRDLEVLDEQGTVIRTYGGAMSPNLATRSETRFDIRMRQNEPAKNSIGNLVQDYIPNHSSIMINSGTTTLAVAGQFRPGMALRIITSNLLLPSTVDERAVSEIYMIGGPVRVNAQSTNGPIETGLGIDDAGALDARCDFAIIGISGIQAGRGFLAGNIAEAHLMRSMITRCKTVIMVADSSKFGRTGFARVCEFDAADLLVSDAPPSIEVARDLERSGVDLLLPTA